MEKLSWILLAMIITLINSLHFMHLAIHQDKLMSNHLQKYSFQVNYNEAPPSSAMIDDLQNSNLNYYYGGLDMQSYNLWKTKISNQQLKCNETTPYATFNIEIIGKNKTITSQCISCEPIEHGININTSKILFNLYTRKCEVCRPNVTAICNNLLNLYSSVPNIDLPVNTISSNQTNGNTNRNTLGLDLCPPAQPLYNSDNKQCQACPTQTQFNGITQKCLPIIYTTNLRAPNLILQNLGQVQNQQYDLQQDNKNRSIQQCPIQKPYLQNKICIKCQSSQLYNFTSQSCTQGCGQGFFYNTQQKNCGKALYYSDSSANNIVSQSGNFNNWKKQTDSLSNASIRMLKCPSDRPFSINNICVGCSGDTPLFDIDQQQCSSCSRGRYFSSEKHQCLGIIDESSSLKRMLANIS